MSKSWREKSGELKPVNGKKVRDRDWLDEVDQWRKDIDNDEDEDNE
jgi:hypothetical protein